MPDPLPAPPPGPPPTDFPARWASDWGEDRFGLWQAFTCHGVRQGFRWCPPGRFQMGSPAHEPGRSDDETPHEAILTRGLWLAETACTQALWEAVMGKNPSRFPGAQRPVEQVNWEEVQGFIGRLNRLIEGLGPAPDGGGLFAGLTGGEGAATERLRLPTEAEWEYACRAGTTGPFSFGEDIQPEQANFNGNHPYRGGPKGLYRGKTVAVMTLPPNPWGLYEMHGNVWEWCQDWDGPYPAGPVLDPAGPAAGELRVVRGGGWFLLARSCRSARRYARHPGHRCDFLGFRLARGPEPGWSGRQAG